MKKNPIYDTIALNLDDSIENTIVIMGNPFYNYFFAHTEIVFYIFIGAFSLFFVLTVLLHILLSFTHTSEGLATVIAFMSVLIIGGTLFKFVTLTKYMERTIILDNEKEICTVKTTMFFKKTIEEIPFHNFRSVILTTGSNREDTNAKLSGKKSFYLGTCTFSEAEHICAFLSIPLRFTLGAEKIVQFPGEKHEKLMEKLEVVTCTNCGSNTHRINSKDSLLTCSFCNTVSRIQWKRS